jgi:signal transduction histidine kinase/CheY-like chemotaxis protein
MSGEYGLRVRELAALNDQDLRARSLKLLAGVLAAASLLGWWWLLPQRQADWWLIGLTTVAIPLFALACAWAERRLWLGMGMVCFCCLAAAVVVSLRAVPPVHVALLMLLPGIALAGVCRIWVGIAAGLAVPLAAAAFLPEAVSLGAALQLILVQLVFVAVLWPRESILAWSWQRSAEATLLAEQLRDRQAELNKAVDQLHLAYQLLEKANRDLALAHREAAEARRLKEEFAASVSHELRTPLNIILGFAEIMQRTPAVYGVELPPMLRADLAEIWRSARYMSELVDDILELSRLDALEMPVRREQADLAAVIEDACNLARHLAAGKPVKVRMSVPAELPPVFIDRIRVRQVLVNLLCNAIRFTDRGSVSVSAEVQGQEIVVRVCDTGVGIPPEELERIFEEFHQVQGERMQGGKGLGLAVAKRFVQMHGGRIWAESKPGQGSVFSFSLPVYRKEVALLRGMPVHAAIGGGGRTVIVAGCDALQYVATYLERHLEGCHVIASDRPEMLPELVRQHRPDLIILGDRGEGSGLDARALPAGVPLVQVDIPVLVPIAGNDCFDALLNKPVSPEVLLTTMRRFVERGLVFVVDDDRSFVQLVRRAVQSAGAPFELRWAYDGQEALERLQGLRPDLVLLDVMMEPVSGAAVAKAVRADPRLSGVPVIAVTGATSTPPSLRPREFRLVKGSGLRDREVLDLLRSVLEHVQPEPLASGSTA